MMILGTLRGRSGEEGGVSRMSESEEPSEEKEAVESSEVVERAGERRTCLACQGVSKHKVSFRVCGLG